MNGPLQDFHNLYSKFKHSERLLEKNGVDLRGKKDTRGPMRFRFHLSADPGEVRAGRTEGLRPHAGAGVTGPCKRAGGRYHRGRYHGFRPARRRVRHRFHPGCPASRSRMTLGPGGDEQDPQTRRRTIAGGIELEVRGLHGALLEDGASPGVQVRVVGDDRRADRRRFSHPAQQETGFKRGYL